MVTRHRPSAPVMTEAVWFRNLTATFSAAAARPHTTSGWSRCNTAPSRNSGASVMSASAGAAPVIMMTENNNTVRIFMGGDELRASDQTFRPRSLISEENELTDGRPHARAAQSCRFGASGSGSFRVPHANGCRAQAACEVSRYDRAPANRFANEFGGTEKTGGGQ